MKMSNKQEWAVSIVMPCYNTENYIGKTMKSLYGQSMQNFELVAVNDGSTDGTLACLEACRDRLGEDRVQIITVENGGQSRARNIGLDHAKGKYIIFLDSDDYVDVDYIEVLYRAAEENNSEMVLSGQHKVDLSGNTIANISYPVDVHPEYVQRQLNPHGKLYLREFLDRHNIRFAEGKLYEDNPFNLMAMFLCKNQVILPYNGHYQVIHTGSTMTKAMDPNKVPYDAIEQAVAYVLEHKDLVVDESVFEFVVLSFLTYFLFMANRKHIYASGRIRGRKSSPKLLHEICKYICRVVPQYFPKYYKNPHVGVFKHRYLHINQRLGVKLFTILIRTKLLWPFTRIFYLF